MTFGEKLYQLRKQRGISQESLAQELNVSRQAISRWELNEVVPDTENVLAVSRRFGVSTDYLLRDECEREEDTPLAKHTELNLRQRQNEVGKGILLRIFWLSPLVSLQLGRIHPAEGSDSAVYLLLLQAFFCALLFREYWQHFKQNDGWYQKLRRSDSLAFGCLLILPYLLEKVLGPCSVLAALAASILFFTWSVKQIRLYYRLPWGKHTNKM